MNLEQIITELKAEREKLTRAIDALESSQVPLRPSLHAMPTGTAACRICGELGHNARRHNGQSKKKRGTYTPRKAKYYENGRKVIASPTGKVRCIDCGQGPFDIGELDIHLKSCQDFALADRSNGNGSKR